MLPGRIFRTNYSLDGKGGADSTNTGKPTKKTGSNYGAPAQTLLLILVSLN